MATGAGRRNCRRPAGRSTPASLPRPTASTGRPTSPARPTKGSRSRRCRSLPGAPSPPMRKRPARAVCIIGETVRKNLFSNVDPIGRELRLGGVACPIIGKLKKRGQGGGGNDQDDIVLMPLQGRPAPASRHQRYPLHGGRGDELRQPGGQRRSRACCASAATSPPRRRQFPGLRHQADFGDAAGHDAVMTARSRRRVDLADRRRDRDHEHHARLGDRADPRDRHPPRHRRGAQRGADAVPGRGGGAVLASAG